MFTGHLPGSPPKGGTVTDGLNRLRGVFRASILDIILDLGGVLGGHGDVDSGCSLKMRFGAPEPLGIWAQLRAAGSNLAVSMCAGPELLGTVA